MYARAWTNGDNPQTSACGAQPLRESCRQAFTICHQGRLRRFEADDVALGVRLFVLEIWHAKHARPPAPADGIDVVERQSTPRRPFARRRLGALSRRRGP
jgi:hypothetical protein